MYPRDGGEGGGCRYIDSYRINRVLDSNREDVGFRMTKMSTMGIYLCLFVCSMYARGEGGYRGPC